MSEQPRPLKTNPFRARLSSSLAGQVEREAKERGISVSAVIREALQERYTPKYQSSVRQRERLAESLKKLANEFHPIGSNLNQLAYAFNSLGKLDLEAMAHLQDEIQLEFAKTRRVLKAVEDAIKS